MKIVEVRITQRPIAIFEPLPKIIARLKNGKEHLIGEFYPREVNFQGDEFTGLTMKDAKIKFKNLSKKNY